MTTETVTAKKPEVLSLRPLRKGGHEVEILLAGPATFICNECVELAPVIIEQHRRKTGSAVRRRGAARFRCRGNGCTARAAARNRTRHYNS